MLPLPEVVEGGIIVRNVANQPIGELIPYVAGFLG